MESLDTLLFENAQPTIDALANLPKTYTATAPPWAGQVQTLPGPCTGAHGSELCNGYDVTAAAYGDTSVRGTEAFAYLWRRFGPPWWGADPHKDLVQYMLHTSHPEVFLTLALSASTLSYCVGYMITRAMQQAWHAPLREWDEQFKHWWMTSKLTQTEQAAIRTTAARGVGPAPTPLAIGLYDRCWQARHDDTILDEAEAAIGPYPHRQAQHPGIGAALHEALIECLRPVFIRDVAINILGHVPDDQLDDREEAPASDYAGYGVPREAMDALRTDDLAREEAEEKES